MKKEYDFAKIKVAQCQEVKQKLAKDLGREPLDEEVAMETGIEVSEVRELLKYKLDELDDNDFQLRFKMTIKNHELEKARMKLGLTQEQVSIKLGLGKQTYCAIESCRQYPDTDKQKVIAKLYNQPIDKLFPAWLATFSEKWNRTDKSRVVPVNTLELNNPEVLLLESGDYEAMQEQADNTHLKKIFARAILNLTPREQDILQKRFFQGMTLSEVGKSVGYTQERIRQIEAKALDKLRQLPELKAFRTLN